MNTSPEINKESILDGVLCDSAVEVGIAVGEAVHTGTVPSMKRISI